MSIFQITITEFTGTEPDNGTERLAIKVDDDPSKLIMRLLSAEKRGPKKAKTPALGKGAQ